MSQFVSIFGAKQYGYVPEADLWNKGYKCNPIVYSVISQQASKTASLPLVLMDGEEEVDTENELYQLFFNNWNSEYGHEEGLQLAATNLLVFGVAYIQKKRSGLVADELFVLPNQDITPEQGVFSYYSKPAYYDFFDGVTKYRIPSEDIIVIRLPFDLSQKRNNYSLGLSPLQSVWDTVLASNNRAEAEKSIYENRGAIGFISPKPGKEYGGKWSDGVFNYVQEKLKGVIGGADKANKIVSVQSPVDFTQVGMSANDMKLIEAELPHVRRISGVYGYPSQLVGDFQSSQYANYKEAQKSAYTGAVLPLWDLINNALQKDLFSEYNALFGTSYYLSVDKTKIIVLSKSWEDNLLKLPQGLQSKVIETLTEEEIEQIKNSIGINLKQNEQ